ncbi:hypothetical protein QR98_0087250, partial [Sarcoptes scabiei]
MENREKYCYKAVFITVMKTKIMEYVCYWSDDYYSHFAMVRFDFRDFPSF